LISIAAEYALRAVVYLATSEGMAGAGDIARATQAPPGYLHKVLQRLGRAGVVRAQRGPGGGFALVKAPADLTALEVVSAVDPIRRIRECPLGKQEHALSLCPLHRRLDEAAALVERAMAQTPITDLIEQSDAAGAQCVFPLRVDVNGEPPERSAG